MHTHTRMRTYAHTDTHTDTHTHINSHRALTAQVYRNKLIKKNKNRTKESRSSSADEQNRRQHTRCHLPKNALLYPALAWERAGGCRAVGTVLVLSSR